MNHVHGMVHAKLVEDLENQLAKGLLLSTRKEADQQGIQCLAMRQAK